MFIEHVSGQKIKIKFDINEKQLLLGDILKITAAAKNGVLAQVTGISTAENNPNFNVAESKILFTIDSFGKLINWQGNIPSQNFMINKLSAKEVLLCSNTLNPQNPVPLGTLSLYPDTEVNFEASFFEKPTVIYCDKQTQKDNILDLLSCEFSKYVEKTVLIDFNNTYADLKVSLKLEAGKNIKLPFDLKGLELLYNKSLSGVSPETRATIEAVFMEVENYLSSEAVEFIPFSSFRQAVDSVYETNKLTELVLLKNKLLKLQKQGVFADKRQEITSLTESFRNNNLVILDLSKFPSEWQKNLIEFIIDSNTNKYKQKFFLVFDSDKIDIDKSFIENICTKANKNGIYPVIIAGHESETAVSLLSYTANIIAFAPENTTKITALRDNLIRLKDNEAVITGKITNNLPLYLNIYNTEICEESVSSDDSYISTKISPEIYLFSESEDETLISPMTEIFNQDKDDVSSRKSLHSPLFESADEEEDDDEEIEENSFSYSNQFEHDETGIELINNISKLQEEVYTSQEEEFDNPNTKNEFSDEDFDDDDISEDEDEKESEFELEQEDSYNLSSQPSSFYDEIEKENNYASSKKYASGFSEDDLSSFIDEDIVENTRPSFDLEEQGDEDFDYNSTEEFQDESMLDYGSFYDETEEQNEDQDDDISNNEYVENYLDEEEEDVYEIPQSHTVQIKTAEPSMPAIPIYSTPKNQNTVSFDEDFQEGDKVRHVKYGLGTVTKIIGSSDKRLCSIQFEDVGRRLLDPKLAELEKI